jgi:plasmid stability protein
MSTLSIRNLPKDVHRELRLRAARNGRSMEAEARAILSEACRPRRPIGEVVAELQGWIDSSYGAAKPSGVVDELLRERRAEAARE